MSNKLAEFLRLATPAEREELADAVSTSTNYLYQLAGGQRRPGITLGVRIERATTEMHQRTAGRLPVVLVEDMAGV